MQNFRISNYRACLESFHTLYRMSPHLKYKTAKFWPKVNLFGTTCVIYKFLVQNSYHLEENNVRDLLAINTKYKILNQLKSNMI